MSQSDASPTRRELLKSAASAAAVTHFALPWLVAQDSKSAATQSAAALPERHIPTDKGITREALAALHIRGKQRVYTGDARKTIGMPCGGIAAGQLYVLGDGTLGHWAIDGEHRFSGWGADNYRTFTPPKPIEQGFAIAVTTSDRRATAATLDEKGYDAIEFTGEYPVARIKYRKKPDPQAESTGSNGTGTPPVEVDLEVYSPFVPLNARDSAYPATILRFSVKNASAQKAEIALAGWLQNMTFHSMESPITILRQNSPVRLGDGLTSVRMGAIANPPPRPKNPKTRVLYDFESGTYEGWKVEGKAFADKPAEGTAANQNPVSGFGGKRLVNSYAGTDQPTGKMTSAQFTIDLPYMTFLIGGGGHKGKTCMNLIVDGKVVRSETGRNNEKLERRVWDLTEFASKDAKLEIVDQHSGAWGHVNVDEIALTNTLPEAFSEFDTTSLEYGDMALTLIGEGEIREWSAGDAFLNAIAQPAKDDDWHQHVLRTPNEPTPPVSTLISRFTLDPGQSRDVTFIISWYFPNLHTKNGVMYSNWFKDSLEVAREIAKNLDRLRRDTLLFCDTYYRDTTLPWWLNSRLMMPISTLATGTCQWWKNGRFWAWEGVGSCEGTCTHVWNYSHGEAFLFPEIARSTRTMQDLGAGFNPETGLVGFRSDKNYAADGQAGTVLKCYREHLLSADGKFLKENWPKIKKVLEYSILQDRCAAGTAAPGGGGTTGEGKPGEPVNEPDGIIENSQHNTFDINFVGPNTFVGSLYLAALRAGQEMATLMGETDAAARYKKIFESGRDWTAENLFNGEYFEQKTPPGAADQWQYGTGCLSDQLFGQSWAHLLNLGHLYPPDQVRKALTAVYKYNWAPDIGPRNSAFPPERWFARPGEGGLFTCTWPNGGRQKEPVRYRDEVWTGIEYQVAAGMIWDGLVDEALTVLRAVDDRYDGAKHNPWNEVECGDHYARAMASWGVLLALAGFNYDGPAGILHFNPRITPEDFACFFTTAGGWGTIRQKRGENSQTNSVELKWGTLQLDKVGLTPPAHEGFTKAKVAISGARNLDIRTFQLERISEKDGSRLVTISLKEPVKLVAGESLDIALSW